MQHMCDTIPMVQDLETGPLRPLRVLSFGRRLRALSRHWLVLVVCVALRGASLHDKLRLLCATFPFVGYELRRRLPCRLGILALHFANRLATKAVVRIDNTEYVLVDADCLWILSPEFEYWMPAYLKVTRGETFLDVGAHIGRYSLQIAKNVEQSRVIAVEANPKNYQALTRGIDLNKLDNVISLNFAAWNKSCKMKLWIGKTAGFHSLKERARYAGSGYVVVEGRQLDEVLEKLSVRKVDWMKIDAEGAELEVLQGLIQTILRDFPTLVCEVMLSDYEAIVSFLKQLGYSVDDVPDGYVFATRRQMSSARSP